jgi:hypothetical protein
MKTINLTEESQPQLQPSVATIGFFDGVHRGHRFLIERLVETAHANGLESTIITFDRHPREVIETDYTPKLLSTCDEKMVMLSKTNIDNCVVLKFTPEMAALSAHDFMKRILCDRLNVKKLFIGYDNRFGHDRSEGFRRLCPLWQRDGHRGHPQHCIRGERHQREFIHHSPILGKGRDRDGRVLPRSSLYNPRTRRGGLSGGTEVGLPPLPTSLSTTLANLFLLLVCMP